MTKNKLTVATCKTIYQDRREKLARFLHGLPIHRFEINTWYNDRGERCGTVACAAGWCPTVFPGEWYLTKKYKYPLLKSNRKSDYCFDEDCLMDFFGLTEDQVDSIFMPSGYSGGKYDGVRITPKVVARKLLAVKGK